MGIAAAGFVDAAGERVRFAPHLPWRDEERAGPARRALGHRRGARQRRQLRGPRRAARTARRAAPRTRWCVTLGTGIGGALVLDGAVHRGRNGMAGEFGHMQVVPDGRPCECGGRGCWEQYSSGNALVRYARDRIGASRRCCRSSAAATPTG